jgi:hypothetical protein
MTLAIPEFKQLKQSLSFLGIMSALVVAILGIQTGALQKLRSNQQVFTPLQLEQDVTAKADRIALFKKMPSFGFDNLIADSLMIDFIQYFGDHDARKATGYGLGLDYFDAIIDKDPKFFLAYFFLSVTGTVYSAQPDRSIAIMERGFKSMTPRSPENAYYLWRLKGTDELLFLGNAQAASKSMLTAADWANQIGDPESQRVANLSRATAKFLAKNPKSKLAQFAAWAMVIDNGVDVTAKKIAVQKIRELGGKVDLDSNGQIKLTPPPKD